MLLSYEADAMALEQRWNIGVEAAFVANEAHRRWQAARRIASATSLRQTYLGMGREYISDLEAAQRRAELYGSSAAFEAFSNVVGEMIGREALGEGFERDATDAGFLRDQFTEAV